MVSILQCPRTKKKRTKSYWHFTRGKLQQSWKDSLLVRTRDKSQRCPVARPERLTPASRCTAIDTLGLVLNLLLPLHSPQRCFRKLCNVPPAQQQQLTTPASLKDDAQDLRDVRPGSPHHEMQECLELAAMSMSPLAAVCCTPCAIQKLRQRGSKLPSKPSWSTTTLALCQPFPVTLAPSFSI